MSDIIGWLIVAILIVGLLRILPRWLMGIVLLVAALQWLHPQAIRHVTGAAVVSAVLEPLLTLGFVLLGLWVIASKGFGARRKR